MLREAVLGLLAGTFSGITPGIHVNTLALLARSFEVSPVALFVMGLTHTFLDVIPSTFLGVPDEGTSLSILPAHRLVLKGRGMEVVRTALVSSALAYLLFLPFIPLYLRLAPLYTPVIGKLVVLMLILLLIFTERASKLDALLILLLSGLLGMLSLSLPLRQPLYHLFVGLFGVPVVISAFLSGAHRIVPGDSDLRIPLGKLATFSFLGTVFGMFASLVPAFTASQAALMGSFISKDDRSFLVVVYSVNTSNFLFSTLNFLETGRIRNGVLSAMPPLGLSFLPALLISGLFVTLASLLYGEAIARVIALAVSRVSYGLLNLAVLAFLLFLSAYFDGPLGVLVLLTSSGIGYLAIVLGVRRTNCMGVLMLPILLR
jgi:putative membrane protein